MSGSLKALESRIVLPVCVTKHDNMAEWDKIKKAHKWMHSVNDWI